MFLLVSVILFTGDGVCYPSMHCRWYPSMPCSRSQGGSAPRRGMSAPRGLLRGGVFSWGCGLLLWPSGLVAFWAGAFWFGGLLVWCLWSCGLLVWCFLVWWPSGLVPSGVASGLVAFWLKVVFWFGAFWFGSLLVQSGLLVWWPSGSKWPSGFVASG